jgi:hypothetical protein
MPSDELHRLQARSNWWKRLSLLIVKSDLFNLKLSPWRLSSLRAFFIGKVSKYAIGMHSENMSIIHLIKLLIVDIG